MGNFAAVQLIEGDLQGGQKVVVRGPKLKALEDKDLNLVMFTGEVYYAVEHEKPAPRKPRTFVFKASDVDWIELVPLKDLGL
jgi:hypothetical protein